MTARVVLLLVTAALAACPPAKPFHDSGPADASGDSAAPPDRGVIPDRGGVDAAQGCKHPVVKQSCKDGFCAVAPGCFWMGSPPTEHCREAMTAKETRHAVTLSRRFELGQFEVTQAQFKALLGADPSEDTACGADCPVDNVGWHQAAAYCNALSASKKLATCYQCSGSGVYTVCNGAAPYTQHKLYACPGYRLPTEAEWEYAYRAGSSTAFYSGPVLDTTCIATDANAGAIGWYSGNANNKKHPQGLKAANKWGLYDMPGNVAEWCHERFAADLGAAAQTDPWGPAGGAQRVIRGGAWRLSPPGSLRAAYRWSSPPGDRGDYIGFRCARTLP